MFLCYEVNTLFQNIFSVIELQTVITIQDMVSLGYFTFIKIFKKGDRMKNISLLLLCASAMMFGGCFVPQTEKEDVIAQTVSDSIQEGFMYQDTTDHVIYLAGGCFWGIEQLMQSIPGVLDAQSGYANGTGEADANYRTVSTGKTGFRETVRVEYDPEQVSLDALLLAYFYVIDPTVENQQGNDRGTQYQTGVYYTNEAAKETVERIAAIERSRSP